MVHNFLTSRTCVEEPAVTDLGQLAGSCRELDSQGTAELLVFYLASESCCWEENGFGVHGAEQPHCYSIVCIRPKGDMSP